MEKRKLKKILVISYNFPPEGGPAVQRVAKFCKYLRRNGLEVFVLTATKRAKITDPSLLENLENIKVSKTRDIGVLFRGDLKKVLRSYFPPDTAALWRLTAVKKGIRLVERENIDLIFSTSPPHSSHIVAEKIAKKTGIPWVVDFRDEWSNNPSFYKYASQLQHKLLEKRVLKSCSHIIAVTEKGQNNFEELAGTNNVSLIRNGFDQEDFLHLDAENGTVKKNKITFAYAGRLNELHNPVPFFSALNLAINQGNIDTEKFCVEIIGSVENRKWLNDFPRLDGIVNFIRYQPHPEMLKRLAAADALLLFATGMNNTEFFPAKVFEYFKLNKYILAILSQPGELWQVMDDYGKSYLARESIIEEIREKFVELYEECKSNKRVKPADDSFVNQFSREAQAKKLFHIMERSMGNSK